MKSSTRVVISTLACSAALFVQAAVAQDKPSLSFGLAGIPPVFVTTQSYVAQQEKFFDKYGVTVTLRPFDSGAAAARAVVSGDIDVSISPTPLVVNMMSNAKVDLVAVYGHEKSDYLIGSLDPAISKCEQLKGQAIGVDSIGGARSIALSQMLRACNLKADDTQQVAVSTNVHQAMISGQLKVGVLHIDDVPIIEGQSGKKIDQIVAIGDVVKTDHYMSVITTRKKVAEKRDALVRFTAALIEAERFMADPKNIDAVAKAAAPTGRSPAEAKWAIGKYLAMGFWPKDDGLAKTNVDATIKAQVAVGGIRAGVEPVAYDKYADESIYKDALALVKK
jgi:ABC-type nitrate/sulfonate/bicarbonate transport system substrate-binding protein